MDEQARALTSTGPNDGGEEFNRGAEVSTLAFRERSSEVEAGAVDPAVVSQLQPQPQPPQQVSEPAENSVSGRCRWKWCGLWPVRASSARGMICFSVFCYFRIDRMAFFAAILTDPLVLN